MQTVIISIITTVIGVVVAIMAARHYYRRSSKHRLAVYWLPSSPGILYGVDPEIRNELSIEFRGEKVKALNVWEFLIANEGANAIRDSIRPLEFEIKDQCRIVDVSVTYIYPEGREVAIRRESDSSFKCVFPLLNPGEYFYVKLITDGAMRPSDITCTISAEDLPPRLQVESSEGVSIGNDASGFSWGLLVGGVVVLAIGSSIVLPMVALYLNHPSYFPFAWSKFDFVWWLGPALAVSAALGFIVSIAGVGMIVTSLVGDIPPRRKFKGPRRSYFPYHAYGYGFPEPESATVRYPREPGDQEALH
jgi:hypothetical protein